jgi:predicted DsbA family dithiol-disulfide isomerase
LCAAIVVVSFFYYTDPACPHSWASEPARRRLEREFAGSVSITYVMGGLAREFDRPLEDLRRWLEAAAASSMPIDPRLWLDAPPRGSYPACIAVCAAAEQDLGGAYLRRAREAMAFEGRRLDHADPLTELARDVPGLDVEHFKIDLSSNAMVEAFGADLDRTRSGESVLPRLEAVGSGEESPTVVTGPDLLDPDAWTRAAVAAGARPVGEAPPGVESALRAHGRLATPEVAAVCGLPGPRAAAELWRLAGEWRVRPERHLSGETWSLA